MAGDRGVVCRGFSAKSLVQANGGRRGLAAGKFFHEMLGQRVELAVIQGKCIIIAKDTFIQEVVIEGEVHTTLEGRTHL